MICFFEAGLRPKKCKPVCRATLTSSFSFIVVALSFVLSSFPFVLVALSFGGCNSLSFAGRSSLRFSGGSLGHSIVVIIIVVIIIVVVGVSFGSFVGLGSVSLRFGFSRLGSIVTLAVSLVTLAVSFITLAVSFAFAYRDHVNE